MAREKATGKIPNGFDDLCVFVPSKRQIICIQEGSGDNLSDEDLDEGYVDYIYYTQYSLEDFEEEDEEEDFDYVTGDEIYALGDDDEDDEEEDEEDF